MKTSLINKGFSVLSNEEMKLLCGGGGYCVCWQDFSRSEGADGSYFMAFFDSAEAAMQFANHISCYSSVCNVEMSCLMDDVVVTN